MFKHILVPLDGSQLSEVALAPAELLARTLGVPITLIHIIEQGAPSEVHNDRHLTESDEAQAYLSDVAHRAFLPEIKVETHVHSAAVDDVARSIVQHTQEEPEPDLIVMCTHGKGGVRDLLFGSIAQQVIAQGTTPLLLVRPTESKQTTFELKKIFVPLDSESVHDDSLPLSEKLASAFEAELYLLSVIPTLGTLSGTHAATGSLLPGATTALLDINEENATVHLQEHLDSLHEAGLRASAEVARGDPATVIVKTAERTHSDLIVLSTHRKAWMDAFWARSVAPNVANHSNLPLLLIPMK
jgi:nucleotide-binding universal stress UspA family protein